MFYYSATNLLGLKYSLASVASYTLILTAWRRFAEAYTVSFLAFSSSIAFLIVLLQVPLKNNPNFWYKIGVLGSIHGLFGSIIRSVQYL